MTVLGPGSTDSLGIGAALAAAPDHLVAAVAGMSVEPPVVDAGVSSFVLLGAGVAGLATDLAATLLTGCGPLPVQALRRFVDPPPLPGALVVAVSLSGRDPEVIVDARAAVAAGNRVVAVSTDPAFAARIAPGIPETVVVPSALPADESALALLSVAPAAAAIVALYDGVSPGSNVLKTFAEAAGVAARTPSSHDPAAVASRIGRTFPLMCAPSGLLGLLANRWKASIGLLAKTPSFAAAFPDLLHLDLAGWGQGGDITRQILTLVTLRNPPNEDALTARSFAALDPALTEVVGAAIEVDSDMSDPLAAYLSLAHLGDLVGLALAAQEGTDPGPLPALVDALEYLRTDG